MRARFTCALCVAVGMFGATACRRQPSAPPTTTSTDATLSLLALVPADADLVFAADLDKLRGQFGWGALSPALVRTAKPLLDGFESRTGLDLTRHLHRVVVALPAERQNDDRFVLIAEVDRLDETRLRNAIAKHLGADVAIEVRDRRQILLRRGTWAKTATTKALGESSAMRRLCERAGVGQAVWFAAIVPANVRRSLWQDARFSDAASMARVSGNLDLQTGLTANVAAELMSGTDATNLVHRLSVYLNQMKRQPDMLVYGLSPILDAIRLSVNDATVQARLELPMAQLAEAVERFESLAQSFRTK